jgi:SAM-dependent methyltransferase
MSSSTDKTNTFYAPLFSRFTAEVGTGTPAVETTVLARELSQIDGVPEFALVLDAGSGTGRYSAAWKALYPGATIVGVDINRTILTTGQVNPAALSRVNGTLERLPFANGQFDVVMSRGVIQHTANPRKALEELLRVCKPGGLLYFYTYRHGTYDVVLNQLRKVARAIGSPACSRAIYGICRVLRLDPRAPTMILDELFVPIRFAFKEATIREWPRPAFRWPRSRPSSTHSSASSTCRSTSAPRGSIAWRRRTA